MNERQAELLADFTAESLSEADASELLRLARNDPQAAAALADEFESHAMLQAAFEPFSAEENEKRQQCVLFYLKASGEKTNFFKRIEARIGDAPPPSSPKNLIMKQRQWLRWLGGIMAAAVALAAVLYSMLNTGSKNREQAVAAHNRQLWSAAVIETAGTTEVSRDGKKIALVPGFAVLPGDAFETASLSRLAILYNDGTELRLDAGTRMALAASETASDATPSKLIRLENGSVRAKVSKQPEGAPLLIDTAHVQVRVIGTEFTLAESETFSQLDLKVGVVQVTQADARQMVELHAGQSVRNESGKSAVVSALAPETFSVDDFESGSLTQWAVGQTPTTESWMQKNLVAGKNGRFAMHVSYHAVGDDWVWIENERFLEDPQDWSGFAGIQFWFNGSNSGNTILCEVYDNRQPGGARYDLERFRCAFRDDREGWRLVRLNFKQFEREAFPNTPNDGFDRKQAHGIGFIVTHAVGAFDVDDITLYADAPSEPQK